MLSDVFLVTCDCTGSVSFPQAVESRCVVCCAIDDL